MRTVFPSAAFPLALKKAGSMIMGAVYNPFLKEFYFAERGQGATLNGQPIQVSGQTDR